MEMVLSAFVEPPPIPVGSVVRVKKTDWYASHGDDELYLFSECGLIRLADIYAGRPFWGADNSVTPGLPEHLETSGGPFCGGTAKKIKVVGTHNLPCWRWLRYPVADGGVDYVRQVPLYECDFLQTEPE